MPPILPALAQKRGDTSIGALQVLSGSPGSNRGRQPVPASRRIAAESPAATLAATPSYP